MRKFLAAIAIATAALVGFAAPSQAGLLTIFQPKPKIVATVSLAEQKMYVAVTDNRGRTQTHVWSVSTGARGFETPKGEFTPTWLSKDHKSSQYDDAPMPHAVFFNQGIAVHGTDAVARLGSPASHGCVRLTQENAATFFGLVQAYGRFNTKIVVKG
jgi:lipoprotein-anchoring transpeptidase ErfK/SrfK